MLVVFLRIFFSLCRASVFSTLLYYSLLFFPFLLLIAFSTKSLSAYSNASEVETDWLTVVVVAVLTAKRIGYGYARDLRRLWIVGEVLAI
jgi:hypothetical protein